MALPLPTEGSYAFTPGAPISGTGWSDFVRTRHVQRLGSNHHRLPPDIFRDRSAFGKVAPTELAEQFTRLVNGGRRSLSPITNRPVRVDVVCNDPVQHFGGSTALDSQQTKAEDSSSPATACWQPEED